jgi:hypothetical protein
MVVFADVGTQPPPRLKILLHTKQGTQQQVGKHCQAIVCKLLDSPQGFHLN